MKFAAFLLPLYYFAIGEAKTPPSWPKSYTVHGTLELPYAELKEPFYAYFDGKKMRSRIDYYGDMVQTFQLCGDMKTSFGQSLKVAPMTTEKVLNARRCFQMNGTKDMPVTMQSVLPDISDFTFMSEEAGLSTDMWQKTEKIGNKKNVYTMWVSNDNGVPVMFEMMGYDTLLGSHYDKYYLKYYNFTVQDLSDDVFKPPKDCGDFPGPGSSAVKQDAEHRITMNPMREYIDKDDSHITEMFHKFKATHKKKYINVKDHRQREHFFRNNVRFIHSKNRAGLGYTLAVNHMADYHESEFKSLRGYRHSGANSQALPFDKNEFKKYPQPPDSKDWRLYGAVTPVKDQAVCGSCWSFGTAGHVEGMYFLKTGELKRLSQQELMDCSWGEGNNACDGGEDFRAYDWIKKHGLASEEDYGPYLGQDGYCHSQNLTATALITDYIKISSGDTEALTMAIAFKGPISVAIDAAHKEFSFYSNGVYYNPQCGNTNDDLDHAVLAVGYGVMNGQNYWLVKNSWSTYWGNDGYVLMSAKDNNCGVATAATYVIMK